MTGNWSRRLDPIVTRGLEEDAGWATSSSMLGVRAALTMTQLIAPLSAPGARGLEAAARVSLRLLSVAWPLPDSVRMALEAYAAGLRGVFGTRLAEVRLFGSHARGEASEDSDIDVLVLVAELTPAEIGVAAGEVAAVIRCAE